nr:MAG TPA: hypothetical protein [Bacteriophage sp.]
MRYPRPLQPLCSDHSQPPDQYLRAPGPAR